MTGDEANRSQKILNFFFGDAECESLEIIWLNAAAAAAAGAVVVIVVVVVVVFRFFHLNWSGKMLVLIAKKLSFILLQIWF
jgi:hypothetical protein